MVVFYGPKTSDFEDKFLNSGYYVEERERLKSCISKTASSNASSIDK
jgi:hypothetical protein